MIYYHSRQIDTEILAALTGAGHDVAVYDADMTDQELYDVVLEADVVLLEQDELPFEEGMVAGLAMAFGKVLYTAPGGSEIELEGYRGYQSLLDATEALLKEQEPGDDARLDGDGSSGADAE